MNQTSISNHILEIIRKEGKLPQDFRPEEKTSKKEELLFAPGAMEGIFSHHVAGNAEGESFIPVLKEYIGMTPKQALADFESRKADNIKVANMRYHLLEDIIAHKEELPPVKVINLAYCFAKEGTRVETVKLGLSMLSLFDLSENKGTVQLLYVLGHCEDFTDYVLMSVKNWSEARRQKFCFALAPKLYGWGKINIVEMLEADTEEKKQWILCHGCKNNVLNSYLGLVCAQKCDLLGRLQKGNLSEEEFRGAEEIMSGLLDEGPCKGMSVIASPVELTLSYLQELNNYFTKCERKDECPEITFVCSLVEIGQYFEKSPIQNADKVTEIVKDMLEDLDVKRVLAENLANNTHYSMQVAQYADVDITDELMGLLQKDFAKYFSISAFYFKDDERRMQEFVVLCEENVNADRYPKGMGNELGLRLPEGVLALDMVVQYLGSYPLLGKKLIEICLNAPIVRWRNMAAKALLAWTDGLQKSLKEIDEDLYQKVVLIKEKECNAKTKEYWDELV